MFALVTNHLATTNPVKKNQSKKYRLDKQCRLLVLISLLLLGNSAYAQNNVSWNLLDVYQAAVSSDPLFAVAQASYLATLETKPQARAALLPQINGFAQYAFVKQEFRDASPFFSLLGSPDFESRGYGIRLDQIIFNRQARIQLHQADTTIAKAAVELLSAKQDLIIRVADAYFAVLTAQDELSYLQTEKAAIQKQLDEVSVRFEVGIIATKSLQQNMIGNLPDRKSSAAKVGVILPSV